MTDRRRRAASSDNPSREDNPFAPPPEGQPDQPWEPRQVSDGKDSGSDGAGSGSDGSGSGGPDDGGEGKPSAWGSKWSSRQPGRQSGGFGSRPGEGNGGNGNGGNGGRGPGGPRGMRWDPTDPLQRHARYALHAGIWGLFFALLGVWQVALLLGALSVYWGINALRGKQPQQSGGTAGRLKPRGRGASAEDVAGTDRTTEGVDTPADRTGDDPAQIPLAVTPEQAAKAKKTAAIGGLVTACLALLMVAGTFTFQQVYKDYYTCQEDALTQSSRDDCKNLLPEKLRPLLENRG